MDDMKCGVIQDLLPIYIDGVASKDTNQLVKEHLTHCEKCKGEFNSLSNDMQNLKITQKPFSEFIKEAPRQKVEKNDPREDSLQHERQEDAKIIRSFKRSIQKKQLMILLISFIAALLISFVSLKIYVESKRPDINGNEMIISTSIAADGSPRNILENSINGVKISKDNKNAYISLPVNSKRMEHCHVRLLLEDTVIDDTMIPISDARYVTYTLDGLDTYESGLYTLEFYDSNDEINQYKWFVLE